MLKMSICTRDNFCVDCDSDTCIGAGKVESDCPNQICIEDGNCENCTFMKWYYAEMKGGTSDV